MRSNTLFKKLFTCFAIVLTITTSCKRTEIPVTSDPAPTNPTITVVNDATQVTASVSGIVLDESNVPVANAVVTSGVAATTTNSNGMFIFQNISLSKENGSITAVKAGYFKGIRSFKTTAGKNHTVRLQLMQRVLSGTVNAALGGTITSNGGATIIFPANAFVTSTSAAYTGVVSVYSRWIDPTAANLPFVIPGDLRGVSTTGVENILETYGMVGAELADASGNILKIATGKTATVSFPIPVSLSATAPTSIVLWHFDETSARWKENGTAAKIGSTYTAQVDKFSFWNCDVGSTNFINLDYTLINATTNSPLVSTTTRIKRVNGSYGYGITNNAGFVSGLVPKNEALVLEVITTSGCVTVNYSQNIGPFATSVSLGNIAITIQASQYINFTGTLLNCSNLPVSNGYISLYTTAGECAFATTNSSGIFSFSVLNCSGTNTTYNYQGTDNVTSLQSTVLTGSTASTAVNLGNINICGIAPSADVYIAGVINNKATIWKNGIATNLTDGASYAEVHSIFINGMDLYAAGISLSGSKATIWKNGIPTILPPTAPSDISIARSVYVAGTDVYVAGSVSTTGGASYIATIWKNGIAATLSNGKHANSVYVTGSDIHVAGVTDGANNMAAVWKNGIATNLNSGSYGNSVYVVDNDVYVAGFGPNVSGSYTAAKYWKNNTLINLTDGSAPASALSIFVSGTDVYVCGFESINAQSGANKKAKVWKNGVATNLTDGTNNAVANSVFVLGSDVYVTGTENIGAVINFKIWKNGLATNFASSNTGSANSIFVK
jgi:hypothetical protein